MVCLLQVKPYFIYFLVLNFQMQSCQCISSFKKYSVLRKVPTTFNFLERKLTLQAGYLKTKSFFLSYWLVQIQTEREALGCWQWLELGGRRLSVEEICSLNSFGKSKTFFCSTTQQGMAFPACSLAPSAEKLGLQCDLTFQSEALPLSQGETLPTTDG